MKLAAYEVEKLVRMALEEDAPWGDVTSQTLIPEDAPRMNALLVAREDGVLAGEDLFAAAMRLTDPAIAVEFQVHDGSKFAKGETLAAVRGPAQGGSCRASGWG